MTDTNSFFFAKLIRDPLLHFFAAGACIYLAYYFVAEPEIAVEDKTVVISEGQIEWLVATWQKRWNRPPTQTELDALISQQVRETVLYREALELGLDKNDAVIRRRLSQKIEFLTQDLLQPAAATDQELADYFTVNIATYQEPSRVSFTQVFFDPDKRKDRTLDDAAAALEILQKTPTDQTDINQFGDAFLLPGFVDNKTSVAIERQFGAGFAEPIFTQETGVWHGPVLSGYGTHLVYVHGRIDPAPPTLDDMRDRVNADWIDIKSREMNDEFLANLMARYTVIVEPAPGIELTAGGS